MINEQYLEKFCIDKINKIGKKLRVNPQDALLNGQFDILNQVLSIIAKEQSWENKQEICDNGHKAINKDENRSFKVLEYDPRFDNGS
ncbi:hypothetical protein [Glutamicibacter sp.]|uniref:hypothetical protein n=1 Tax=Glutamicibacter sp. TaxID=1931995 RepID=UPI002B47955B|nr:hypothetical protein [Glutamicibacter sp.]HJX79189.1 hypothetical protein [Glutamicibacter sp.]